MTARALGNARGAALLSDFIERQKALAGAWMEGVRRQPTQIRRRLAPPRMVNAQHNRSEQGGFRLPDRRSRLSKTMLLKLDAV
jgi:hypothetical protein